MRLVKYSAILILMTVATRGCVGEDAQLSNTGGGNTQSNETGSSNEAGAFSGGADGSTNDTNAGPPVSTCTPDTNDVTCAGHCGLTLDNCGANRDCPTDCGPGNACQNGTCQCVSDMTWCKNRCGSTTDNCGQPVDCGGCLAENQTCTNNTCGCVPDDPATTCAGKGCGTATNNCGQTVVCGNGGACARGICNAANGTCCVDDGVACSGRCAGVVVANNCGVVVNCPAGCPNGQVCTGTSSCITDQPGPTPIPIGSW